MKKNRDNIITVNIPVDLATFAVWQREKRVKYDTNRLIKLLDTLLILKADSIPSIIPDWNKQKADLIKICKVSETIFRHRLAELKKLKLLTYDRNTIRLKSWDEIGQILDVDIKKKVPIEYDITSKERIQDRIIATEIEGNQNRQDYKVMRKLNNKPEVLQAVTAELIRQGADKTRLNDPGYFLSMLKAAYRSDFVQGSEIHDILVEIRPDNNRSVRGMAEAWKCKHPTTVSYWKRIMAKSGIIDVSKLQIESAGRVRNKACKVLWLEKSQQTLLCLADQITVLKPWIKFEAEKEENFAA